MQEIRCHKCGKLLLEAESGEGRKICPKCKTPNHYVVTSIGVAMVNNNSLILIHK